MDFLTIQSHSEKIMSNVKLNFIIWMIFIHIFATLLMATIVIMKIEGIAKLEIDRDDRLMSACGYVLGNE